MNDETEFKTKVIRTDTICCPRCNAVQEAQVLQCEGDPYPAFVHFCEVCKYVIMESEWDIVGEGMEAA